MKSETDIATENRDAIEIRLVRFAEDHPLDALDYIVLLLRAVSVKYGNDEHEDIKRWLMIAADDLEEEVESARRVAIEREWERKGEK